MRRTSLSLFAILVLALSAAAQPAGQIAYTAFQQIHVMNPDGSGCRALTRGADSLVADLPVRRLEGVVIARSYSLLKCKIPRDRLVIEATEQLETLGASAVLERKIAKLPNLREIRKMSELPLFPFSNR